MSGDGRVVCARCGANNFDTQAACWKCGASLSTAASGSAGPAPSPPPSMGAAAAPSYASLRPAPGTSAPAAPAASLPVSPMAAASYRPMTMDPGVAIWSAIALGMLFPYFAVPAGIVFLMLDDRRKAEIGRVTLVWGIIGTVLNGLVTYWMIQGAIAQIRAFIPFPGGGRGITLPNQTQPSLTGPAPQDAVRDLKFPSP